MSIKTTVACDHCGKDVPNTYSDHFRATFMYASKKADVDACCDEHLGFAVAKAFGIPIDGNLTARVDELLRATRNIPSIDGMLKNVTENYEQYKKEAAAKIDELQRRLTGAQYEADEAKEKLSRSEHALSGVRSTQSAKGQTPAEVAYVAYVGSVEWHKDAPPWSELVGSVQTAWVNASNAVLSIFAPGNGQGPARPVFAGNDHPHEVGSGCCDRETAKDFTPPIKPTKPCTECSGSGYSQPDYRCGKCGGDGVER